MKPIKVLIIFPMDPYGRRVGGRETFIREFIKYAPRDFQIEMVGLTSDRERRPVGRWQRSLLFGRELGLFPIWYVEDENAVRRIPLSLKFTLSLFRYKKKIATEGRILQFHRIEPAIPFHDYKYSRLFFIHFNTADIFTPKYEVRWSHFPWLYFKMEKRLIKKMSKIFIVHREGVKFYRERYPDIGERISFLPSWADNNNFYPFSERKKKLERCKHPLTGSLDEDSRILLFCGRLEKAKDPFLMVETFYQLLRTDDKARLFIIGTGSLESELEKEIERKGMGSRVTFLGIRNHQEIAELMRLSDLLILTSAFEGMPRVVLEAMASGLPVVSTDVGEVGRVVKEGLSGYLVQKRSPELLAKKVMDALDDGVAFSALEIVNSVKPYFVENILGRVYKVHKELSQV